VSPRAPSGWSRRRAVLLQNRKLRAEMGLGRGISLLSPLAGAASASRRHVRHDDDRSVGDANDAPRDAGERAAEPAEAAGADSDLFGAPRILATSASASEAVRRRARPRSSRPGGRRVPRRCRRSRRPPCADGRWRLRERGGSHVHSCAPCGGSRASRRLVTSPWSAGRCGPDIGRAPRLAPPATPRCRHAAR